MDRTTEILTINSVEDIPAIDFIRSIPREQTLKLIFEPSAAHFIEAAGERLNNSLPGFQVAVHSLAPVINVVKLITDQEIEANQDFFEQCAKDYRNLSTELINKLANKFKLTIDPKYPLSTFYPLKNSKRQSGRLDGWSYFLHGHHCGFENTITGQLVETALTFGLEFGDLDPYFFTKFIKSTPAYQPLPVAIYEYYADGVRLNEKMLALGKFEPIFPNRTMDAGVVVKDRDKVVVEPYDELPKMKRQKFSFLRFLRWK